MGPHDYATLLLSGLREAFRRSQHRLMATLFSGPWFLQYLPYPACAEKSHRRSIPLDLPENIGGLSSRLAWASSSTCCGRQRCVALTVSAVGTVEPAGDALLRAFAGSDRQRYGKASTTGSTTGRREPTRWRAMGIAHRESEYRAADAMESQPPGGPDIRLKTVNLGADRHWSARPTLPLAITARGLGLMAGQLRGAQSPGELRSCATWCRGSVCRDLTRRWLG